MKPPELRAPGSALPAASFHAGATIARVSTDRRDFIGAVATAMAAVGTGVAHTRVEGVDQGATPSPSLAKNITAADMVGIQMGPHTMLDEGIEHSLDLLQDTAGINTIFTYSHAYGGDLRKPLTMLATDHG